DNRSGLECQNSKGGISRSTPRELAPSLQSLPPILHIPIQHPVSSYSKGARGLSVLMRARGFFIGTTNSLSIPPRQRSSRYAIHAGRNLLDKDFSSVLLRSSLERASRLYSARL